MEMGGRKAANQSLVSCEEFQTKALQATTKVVGMMCFYILWASKYIVWDSVISPQNELND
jgi:hypothetical protein